jgi:hypothetical protein
MFQKIFFYAMASLIGTAICVNIILFTKVHPSTIALGLIIFAAFMYVPEKIREYKAKLPEPKHSFRV